VVQIGRVEVAAGEVLVTSSIMISTRTFLTSRRHRQGGFVLLLSLMVLIVLATLIVQFQADSSLQGRSSSYRLALAQCRYGAESGIVIGSQLVKDSLRRGLRDRARAQAQAQAASAMLGGEIADANMAEEDFGQGVGVSAELAFVLEKRTMTVGDVSVEIEIHDENAKWPMLWLLASPFDGRGNSVRSESGLRELGRSLGVGDAAVRQAIKWSRSVGGSLDIPAPEVTIEQSDPKSKVVRRRRTRRRHLGHKEIIAQTSQRYQAMSILAMQWYDQLRGDGELVDLAGSLESHAGSFADYLGVWGHNKINLNSAPPEVLVGAFGALGMTEKEAQAIAKYRQAKPFTNAGQLREITEIPSDLRNSLYNLVRVDSNTFSVRVVAQMGRTHYTLLGGFYKDTTGKILTQGVISGD